MDATKVRLSGCSSTIRDNYVATIEAISILGERRMKLPPALQSLEMWGGVECTVNRVGGSYRDQLQASGHQDRPDDLDLFARLGLCAIRYPVLWERVSPDHPEERDWLWSDERLARLRKLGLKPIVGLVHHGSGPRYTSLLSPDFATGLAAHARAVAERYPWIRDWTPVNEPVTTARFSALYGLWYPHVRDERAFWLAVLNQIDGTRLAMRAVRLVNPAARLIQTDDLGRTYATEALRRQAAFDNDRRWISWDLLFGRVRKGHALWDRLCGHGFQDRLEAIADDPCPPDIIGINHYLTSDRFLDHRLQRYPAHTHGANAHQSFADIEAVRVLHPPPGLAGVLQEAWDRYRAPLAITEVHNGCTRDEQMRWMVAAWNTARALRSSGVDIRAVTCWSLLGSHDWNTLLTGTGHYEPGVFDVTGPAPRVTAMAPLLSALATDQAPDHPVLDGRGWWRRPMRLHHPATPRPAPIKEHIPSPHMPTRERPPLLILGATGTLGQALGRACRARDIGYVLTSRKEIDFAASHGVGAALDGIRPWAVINAAGWVRVDDAEREVDACFLANASGPAALAEACARRGIPTISFSSDLVFDGSLHRPYVESDAPAPLNIYGRSKHQAEQSIVTLPGTHLIIRTAAFFSPLDVHNFAIHLLQSLATGARFRAAHDQVVSPTYVPQLCDTVLDLLIDGAQGIWHLTNRDAVSWADFAGRLARRGAVPEPDIEAVCASALGWAAPRPARVPLGSEKGRLMWSLDEAIDRFFFELRGCRPELLTGNAIGR